MKKQNENLFREKFRLLNSQDHTEDIKWSSTSSSETESTSCDGKVNNENKRYSKRKRKNKVFKNVSNLDVTFIDSCKNLDSCVDIEKSPILKSRCVTGVVSPVLTSANFPPNRNSNAISPVLSTKRSCPKSPVLSLKTTSPNFSGRIRKKLCYGSDNYQRDGSIKNLNLSCKNSNIDTLDRLTNNHIEPITKDNVHNRSDTISTINKCDSPLQSKLMVKVKNFFDSHFSSDHTSQNISTTDTTPSDCSKNEDIEILSCKTQTVTNLQSAKCESLSNSDTSSFHRNLKKVKYKRGGLAFRLNSLVKKQNAHISLWQHERFLARNSNFIIPKEEHKVFHIQKVDFQYGCYLLQAVDIDNKKHFILINKKYINATVVEDSVLKLYEPFQILSLDSDIKIIVNVCKFECVVIKS